MTTQPELFDAGEDDGPLWSDRRQRMMRVVVWVGIVALVAPGLLITWNVANATAAHTCAVYTTYLDPDAGGSRAGFEFFRDGGPGWQCYAVSSSGPETYLGPLGMIPSAPRIPRQSDPIS